MVVEMELIRPLIGGCKRAVKTFTGRKLAYSRRKHGLPWWLSSKESACNAGNPGSIPGSEDPPEKEMATHSNILAWKITWTEKPGRLQSMELQRVGHG